MNPVITVVTLGPGDPEALTLKSANALKAAGKLMLRTGRHGITRWLDENSIAYETLDSLYDQFWDFDEMHQTMAKKLWKLAAEAPLCYAVMDAATDGSVAALRQSMPKNAALTVLPGISLTDVCMAAVSGAVSAEDGLRVLPAISCQKAEHDPRLPLLITELDNPALAGDVKLWLGDLYPDETEILFFPPDESLSRKAEAIPLWALDRQKAFDHTTCVLLRPSPLSERERFCFRDLVDILDILRSPEGCPWDREQTHQTLRKYLLEEAYEAAGAIDEDDPWHLADELGDVLLQVVFHAAVGKSHGTFTISDVTSEICHKMIYRHEHIFGTKKCDTAEDVSRNWEKLKKAEKGLDTQGQVLADVSRALPALVRAAKVQKKAANVGFDWDSAAEALPKIHEEADEVLAELQGSRDPGEELGDLLFSCVNVARLAGKEPEDLLTFATDKFIRRFTAMENLIISDGKALKDLTLREMDVYWDMVKANSR
ncbi:MAG: nucleoside triphosphate pyrophosphohydrolase [Clostridia bacterium]|nr:nucleoside triphosphate pyrophosphohydrolase [Clostridia bacterium]